MDLATHTFGANIALRPDQIDLAKIDRFVGRMRRNDSEPHTIWLSRRVPAVYLTWANPMFLAFFSFTGISNLRAFNVAFSSIPTAPTNLTD